MAEADFFVPPADAALVVEALAFGAVLGLALALVRGTLAFAADLVAVALERVDAFEADFVAALAEGLGLAEAFFLAAVFLAVSVFEVAFFVADLGLVFAAEGFPAALAAEDLLAVFLAAALGFAFVVEGLAAFLVVGFGAALRFAVPFLVAFLGLVPLLGEFFVAVADFAVLGAGAESLDCFDSTFSVLLSIGSFFDSVGNVIFDS